MAVLFALAVAGGCSGTKGKDGANGADALVEVVAEPAGAHCAAGGQAIRAGRDADRDGVLDAGEITSTSYVCAGGTTLFSSEALAAGDLHCPAGGVALHRGLDADGDATLDAAEVAATDYVCNGAAGATGLASAAPEPAGNNCAAGGVAIRTGVDANGDGLLQPGEVASTAYACSAAAGLTALVRQDDEPAGAGHCTFGGRAISSGVDADRSGTLEPTEVAATSYVCNGAPGAAQVSLVALEDEPAGANCPAGGQRVNTGVDANGNGGLDAGEIANHAYVCSGANRLYATVPAQWGGVCARGGVRVDTGIDANGNGALDAGEVEAGATRYVCNLSVAAVSAGGRHTCALASDATVWCWGANGAGQLGDGTTADRSVPAPVSGLAGVAAVAAGGTHTCALLTDGTGRCWGSHTSGQLGVGTGSGLTSSSTPQVVQGLAQATGLSAGTFHTCARLAGGTAACWGANDAGQLGDGTGIQRPFPVAVSGLTGVTEVAAGGSHSCALVSGGAASCWGANASGQLGDGSTTPTPTPVPVSGLTTAVAIRTGGTHSCALLADDGIQCWGNNASGALGDGSTTPRPTPVAVVGLPQGGAVDVQAGLTHTCAVLASGNAACWGGNDNGQLGTASAPPVSSPEVVGVDPGVAVTTGELHTCLIGREGSLHCWGANGFGQLGDGTHLGGWEPLPALHLGR